MKKLQFIIIFLLVVVVALLIKLSSLSSDRDYWEDTARETITAVQTAVNCADSITAEVQRQEEIEAGYSSSSTPVECMDIQQVCDDLRPILLDHIENEQVIK